MLDKLSLALKGGPPQEPVSPDDVKRQTPLQDQHMGGLLATLVAQAEYLHTQRPALCKVYTSQSEINQDNLLFQTHGAPMRLWNICLGASGNCLIEFIRTGADVVPTDLSDVTYEIIGAFMPSSTGPAQPTTQILVPANSSVYCRKVQGSPTYLTVLANLDPVRPRNGQINVTLEL